MIVGRREAVELFDRLVDVWPLLTRVAVMSSRRAKRAAPAMVDQLEMVLHLQCIVNGDCGAPADLRRSVSLQTRLCRAFSTMSKRAGICC